MTIETRITADLADAMRARDPIRLSALRLLKTAFVNRSIELGGPVDEAESVRLVRNMAKQRHDSIDQFTRGGRQDLVDKERAELRVLEAYLPPDLDPAIVEAAVEKAMASTGATSVKDLGPVMKAALGFLEGRLVDRGKLVELIRARLSESRP